jgi:hypothetical protein
MQQLVHGNVDPPASQKAESDEKQAPPAPIQTAVEPLENVRKGKEHRTKEGDARHGSMGTGAMIP